MIKIVCVLISLVIFDLIITAIAVNVSKGHKVKISQIFSSNFLMISKERILVLLLKNVIIISFPVFFFSTKILLWFDKLTSIAPVFLLISLGVAIILIFLLESFNYLLIEKKEFKSIFSVKSLAAIVFSFFL
ncbi:MAG: hypothetical protein QW210_03940 [Candidatus Woesearchaeota archaeon]